MKTKFVTILLVLLSAVFPVVGSMGTVLAQTSGNISGTVIGADEKPLRGVGVRLVDINNGKVLASTKTAKDGSYRFGELTTGKTYKVNAFHGKDESSALAAASADASKPVALKLSRTKGVMLLAKGKKGFPEWGYVLIALGAVGAGVGIAAAAGAFSGSSSKKAASPSK